MEQETKQKEVLLVIFNILKIISIGIVPLLLLLSLKSLF